jgi:hypothetical protein
MFIPALFISGEMIQIFQNGVAVRIRMALLGNTQGKLKSFSRLKKVKVKRKKAKV